MTAVTNPAPVGHRRWRTKPTPRKISAPSRPPCPSRKRSAASSPCNGGSSRYSPPAASVSGRGEAYRDPDTAMAPRPSPTPSSHRALANLVARRGNGRFPMIGKYFSNGWKSLADFSNDWKNFSRVFQRLEKTFYRNEDSFNGSVPLIPFHLQH